MVEFCENESADAARFVCLSAVASVDTAMGLSLYSTHSLEDVARESPTTIKFMQMQFYTDRQLMETLLKRAEKAGYKAVLLTVDIPVSKYDNHKLRANFSLPRHLKFANFLPLKRKHGFKDNDELSDYVEGLSDDSVDWEILDWLRSITSTTTTIFYLAHYKIKIYK